MDPEDSAFDAWNPGLGSEIPQRLNELITLFREENGEISYSEAMLGTKICGLKPFELCSLSVKRLVIHELLVRVTADLSVPDGPKYEDLGISVRSMVRKLLVDHIEVELSSIQIEFDEFCRKAQKRMEDILNKEFYKVENDSQAKKKFLNLFSFKEKTKIAQTFPSMSDRIDMLREWSLYKESRQDFDAKCRFALARIISGIIGVRGKIFSDPNIFIPLALRVFRNSFGGDEINRLIDPVFRRAVFLEGYRFLPIQPIPIVMNTKGASASGKSTIRPQQRILSERMKIAWADFALISPDYWRKFLLDYESLGSDYKYGAMLTGHELEIIDKKLDLYMEQKARKGEMPHLLIDRFRFDSFQVSKDGNYTSSLLTRFGKRIFLFFVITPPAETVERAWTRGLSTSRYKAVEDLLFHNIEAYTGMPELFFSWMAIEDKEINFEFLDNSVKLGESPKTIAFGRIGIMFILDLIALNNVDTFREVNVKAKKPEEVLTRNTDSDHFFIENCFLKIPKLILIDSETCEIFGESLQGEWVYKKISYIPKNKLEKNCLEAIGWLTTLVKDEGLKPSYSIERERELTLGS